MKETVTQKADTLIPQRMFKDRIFRMIFNGRSELLSLYNAINGTEYQNEDELEINTLEHAIYMGMRNDLSFVIDSQLSLYEHQSTYNPNIPLRDLLYSANLYSKLTSDKNLYGSKLIRIPAPKFVVFYNGAQEQPERKELLLSDAFEIDQVEKSLELKVIMLNINAGYNEALKKECRTLRDYMSYVEKVRSYAHTMSLAEAVERAIGECISDGILAEFLQNNRAEAKSMSIFEYDEELHMQQERAAAREDGLEEGREVGRELGREEGREEGRKEGRKEGREEERKQLLAVIRLMCEDGLMESIPKLTTDSVFFSTMIERYSLQKTI